MKLWLQSQCWIACFWSGLWCSCCWWSSCYSPSASTKAFGQVFSADVFDEVLVTVPVLDFMHLVRSLVLMLLMNFLLQSQCWTPCIWSGLKCWCCWWSSCYSPWWRLRLQCWSQSAATSKWSSLAISATNSLRRSCCTSATSGHTVNTTPPSWVAVVIASSPKIQSTVFSIFCSIPSASSDSFWWIPFVTVLYFILQHSIYIVLMADFLFNFEV